MNFLIDIGNSFIKVMQYNSGQLMALQRLRHTELPRLLSLIEPNDVLLYASVVDEIAEALAHYAKQQDITVIKIASTDDIKLLKNGYEIPEQLGVDRWLAMLGVRYLFPNHNCLVVDSGTATTIDIVTKTGKHLGGWIIPGLDLMFDALNSKTAKISVSKQLIHDIKFGINTNENVNYGVLACTVGCVEQAIKKCSVNNIKIDRIICTGGSGEKISAFISQPTDYIEELIFWGMITYIPNNV